ncbi:MAG: hypothetical protein ACOCZX_01485 [Candidatus Bipolaricaulota bacterium]
MPSLSSFSRCISGGELVKPAVAGRESSLSYSEAFATIAAELLMMAILTTVILVGFFSELWAAARG